MAVEFGTMREFEGRRVQMRFDDGAIVVATLLSATEDIEGSHHLIYELATSLEQGTMYAEGESLESIELAEEHYA